MTTFKDLPDEMIIQTPFGHFKANDDNFPLNSFDFEVLHTNFVLSQQMGFILNKTLGIESVNFLSPYRVILSVGKMFDRERVKQLVELRLVGKILNYPDQNQIPPSIKDKAKSRIGNLIFPNGEVLCLDTDNEDEKEVYKRCAELVGGTYYEKTDFNYGS